MFRPPSAYEQRLFDRLLEAPFPGRDELAVQLSRCEVREVDKNGSLEFRVAPAEPLAPVIDLIPVMGEVEDIDAELLYIQLFVRKGLLSLLDVTRVTGGVLLAPLDLPRMRVFQSIGGYCPPKGFLAPAYIPLGFVYRGAGWAPTDQSGRSIRAHVNFGPPQSNQDRIRLLEQRVPEAERLLLEGEPVFVRGLPARLLQRDDALVLRWVERDVLIELSGAVPLDELLRMSESMYWID
jgi:hypothetical protein